MSSCSLNLNCNKFIFRTIVIVLLQATISFIFMNKSFSESPLRIPPQESSVTFSGKVIPEKKQLMYDEPIDGGVQRAVFIIPLNDTRYVIANFSWTLLPLGKKIISKNIYVYDEKFIPIQQGSLEMNSTTGVFGNIILHHETISVRNRDFVRYDDSENLKPEDLLRRYQMFTDFHILKK